MLNMIETTFQYWLYGASTKGNCLLQFANIGPDSMEYAVERNPKKVGKILLNIIKFH